MLYLLRCATVGLQVLGEVHHRLVISSRRGKQQSPGLGDMHHSDAVLPPFDAGLVNADVAHLVHVVFGTGLFDVVTITLPQPVALHLQLLGCQGNGRRFA